MDRVALVYAPDDVQVSQTYPNWGNHFLEEETHLRRVVYTLIVSFFFQLCNEASFLLYIPQSQRHGSTRISLTLIVSREQSIRTIREHTECNFPRGKFTNNVFQMYWRRPSVRSIGRSSIDPSSKVASNNVLMASY